MKKTRNLLVLNGSPNEVKSVLDSASFKALSILEPSQITAPNINYAFECNKSVLCQDFNLDSINTPKIPILVTSNKVGISPTHDCIDPSKDVLAQLEEIAKSITLISVIANLIVQVFWAYLAKMTVYIATT